MQNDTNSVGTGPEAERARVHAALAAYGADVARWPDADRAAYARRRTEPDILQAMRRARALAGALAAAAGDAPAPSAALRARILAAAPGAAAPVWGGRSSAVSIQARLRAWLAAGLGASLAPAGALAGVAALGFAAGLVVGGPAFDGAAVFASGDAPEVRLAALTEGESVYVWFEEGASP